MLSRRAREHITVCHRDARKRSACRSARGATRCQRVPGPFRASSVKRMARRVLMNTAIHLQVACACRHRALSTRATSATLQTLGAASWSTSAAAHAAESTMQCCSQGLPGRRLNTLE
eukprot:3330999-Prymnesium_polylepis.1